jgi:deazaflavin-dependent oxidoreductase (nitroreductase family)
MDSRTRAALDRGQLIDLTTTGRRSGQPRRIEIVFHNVDGRIVISGMPSPRTRAWLHNVQRNPAVTLHFKGPDGVGDLAGTAREITERADRHHLLEQVARNWNRDDVDVMMQHSPLIEIEVPGYSPGASDAVA